MTFAHLPKPRKPFSYLSKAEQRDKAKIVSDLEFVQWS